MKHYVVLLDWAVDNMGAKGVSITGVAHSLDKAKELFAKVVVDEKKYAKEHDWTIYVDSDDEFDAGEDGSYDAEHAHFYIEEVDAIDDDTAYDCQFGDENSECEEYVPSAENGDYSPSNPWDAPGMKISDFI